MTSWSALNADAGCTATRSILFISGIYLLAEHSQIYVLSITSSAVPDAMQPKARTSHRITYALYNQTRDLLAWGLTNKTVAELTGLGKNTVKEIDKVRLQELYTIDGKKLRKPERQARFLGIDEFKLHDGHKYATHIIDLETSWA